MTKLSVILFIGAAACGAASSDPGVGPSVGPGVDLWCGDSLCDWKLEQGSLLRVPTWNDGEQGVELVGDVAISQLWPLASEVGACLEVELVASIPDNADVELIVDVDADGSIERTEQLPTSRWSLVTFKVLFEGELSGVRLEITKAGPGDVVLASIGATVADDCKGLPPVSLQAAGLGSPCTADTDCASGLCGLSPAGAPVPFLLGAGTVCIGCDVANACTAPDVCGLLPARDELEDPDDHLYQEVLVSPVTAVQVGCVHKQTRVAGEPCLSDAECEQVSLATNIFCTQGTCSTCRTSADCANGETCSASPNLATGGTWTFACALGQHARALDEPCVDDSDCRNGTCSPYRLDAQQSGLAPCDSDDVCYPAIAMECADGRECQTDADCPFGADGQHGACTRLGIEGGYCDD